MDLWREFHGPNAGYVIDLYERFRQNPDSVDEETRAFFEHWWPALSGFALEEAQGQAASTGNEIGLEKAVAVANLAQSIRSYGYLEARLDPLGGHAPGDPTLDPGFYGLTEDDLGSLPASLVGGPVVQDRDRPQSSALEAIRELRRIYCSATGYDFQQVTVPEERQWLRETAESGCFCQPKDPIDPKRLLERLTEVDAFEKFLQRTFPGKTRFSIEGVDMLVPVLDEIIGAAAEDDICVIFIGMAHRGRLNVLANVHHKPFAQILAEFKDPGGSATARQELGWTGDVKYHKGALRALESGEAVKIVLCLPPNPSHLEHVNPVVEGMARAAGTKADQPGAPVLFPKASLPVLIHGDAAFTGQGVVAETLNLSRLPGYSTAGTVHIITNNQLGYTATVEEARSTRHASDLAKGFKIPIIHVNADDPEACIEAARIAFAYREKFQNDFLIDLIGYRRYGHNEGDEPAFTQPVMYDKIHSHPTVREIWAQKLVERGLIGPGWAESIFQENLDGFQKIYETLEPEKDLEEELPTPPPPGAARQVKTSLPLDMLRKINEALLELPEGFQRSHKLDRSIQRRKQIFDARDGQNPATIDWAAAEELAFATILQDGVPIRMTGQDVIRGTFSQRHAAFYDVETGHSYLPLQNLPGARASFEIRNSPLSEIAAVAFEYGYNLTAPERLVLWEAQYGDFANVAQVMIDEFIVSARAKWGQTPSLVMLLPHGNEGQGPDHSSARLERFLQLSAENNLRIAYPTSAAQIFHLLRRQAALLTMDPLPLIVMTPKGLLRHPQVASRPDELAEGKWMPIIDDELVVSGERKAEAIRRLLLCSGRVYFDLAASKQRSEKASLAIARVEQLYPFPDQELAALFDRYPRLERVVWVQEEPSNMGAWEFMRSRLQEMSAGRWSLACAGRPASSSPAEGSATWYGINQRELVEQAYQMASGKVGGKAEKREEAQKERG